MKGTVSSFFFFFSPPALMQWPDPVTSLHPPQLFFSFSLCQGIRCRCCCHVTPSKKTHTLQEAGSRGGFIIFIFFYSQLSGWSFFFFYYTYNNNEEESFTFIQRIHSEKENTAQHSGGSSTHKQWEGRTLTDHTRLLFCFFFEDRCFSKQHKVEVPSSSSTGLLLLFCFCFVLFFSENTSTELVTEHLFEISVCVFQLLGGGGAPQTVVVGRGGGKGNWGGEFTVWG